MDVFHDPNRHTPDGGATARPIIAPFDADEVGRNSHVRADGAGCSAAGKAAL